jgi:hypothetical protein
MTNHNAADEGFNKGKKDLIQINRRIRQRGFKCKHDGL